MVEKSEMVKEEQALEENNLNSKKHLLWIDLIKGIAVILVVIGHNLQDEMILFKIIYSFHVPLFFLISGYCFNIRELDTFSSIIKKKSIALLKPYYILGAISAIIYSIYINNSITVLKTYYFCNRKQMGGETPFNTPLWFLPCLFGVTILYYLLFKYTKKLVTCIFVCVFAFIGYIVKDKYFVPYSLDSGFYYLIFFATGNYLRNGKIGNVIRDTKISYAMISMIIFLSQIFTIIYDIEFNAFFSFIYSFVLALSGIYICYYISKALSSRSLNFLSRTISYLGKNSLLMMALHNPVREYILGILIWGVSGTFYSGFGIRGINTIGSLLLSIPLVELINRKAPYIVRRSK